MAEGRYSRIKSKFWTDEKSGKWDDSTKLLALYLLTSPHINILGCYVLPKGYICEDLGWTTEQLAKPFAKLLADGFIKYDEANKLLLIPNYLKHNPIENRNQAIAALKQLMELPRSPLIAELQQLCEPFRKLFGERFEERFAERYGKPVTVTVTVDESIKDFMSELGSSDASPEPAEEGQREQREEAQPVEPPKPAEKPLKYLPEHLELAEHLRDRILENKPDARLPGSLVKWAETARLMVERDGRSPERIREVIDFCQSHHFWWRNILSMDKLRQQFDRLEAEMNGTPRDSPGKNKGQQIDYRKAYADW